MSNQGREGRKEPELIRRLALRYKCRDIGEGRRRCLPVSQRRVTCQASHLHQRIDQPNIRFRVAFPARN